MRAKNKLMSLLLATIFCLSSVFPVSASETQSAPLESAVESAVSQVENSVLDQNTEQSTPESSASESQLESQPEESSQPNKELTKMPKAADEKPTHTEQQHAPNLRLLSIGQTELSATVVQDTSWHVHGSVVYRIKQTDGGSWSDWAETKTFTGLTPGVQYTIGAKYLPTSKEETYYITNYTESEETTRTVKTAATDQYIVTSEAELRELLASAPSVTERNYISVFNGNDITITQPLTIPALPEGKRLVFDLNGFTVSSTARGAAPLFTVQGDATVDNGTIKTDNSLTAIKIDTAGSLYLRDITIQAGTALENHGTIVGMGNVRFAGGTGLVNYGTVEASSKFSGTQTDSSRPLIDNYGSITVLDLDCKTQCLDSTAVHNNTGATIGTLSGTVSYFSNNSNDLYGTEAAENANGLLRNDGTVDVLCAAFTSRGGVSVSNYGTIRAISDGAKLTVNGNKNHPSIALANQRDGKIEDIKGGSLTGYASSLVNYGEISHVSGGYFQHSSGENVSNYGTIQDISGGGFQSGSGYKWAEKKYFIVNHDSGSYSFRNGYSVSQSPITYDDGTTSGQWRMVGKAHTVTWTDMEDKIALYLPRDIDQTYYGVTQITGQYVGNAYTQTFVAGETVNYYGFDRDRNLSSNPYLLLVDRSHVSLCSKEKESSPGSEIPKENYGNIAATGIARKVSKTPSGGTSFSEVTYENAGWSNIWLDTTEWTLRSVQNQPKTRGYSAEDTTSRIVNENYFRIANTGWQDQSGTMYVTERPTANGSFRMPEKDLVLSPVERIVNKEWMEKNSYASNDVWGRAPTMLSFGTYRTRESCIRSASLYPGVTWLPRIAFNGGEWEEIRYRGEGTRTFNGLTPNTNYPVSYMFELETTSPEFIILPSAAYSKTVSTTARYADIPDSLDVKQISATELEFTLSGDGELSVQEQKAAPGGTKEAPASKDGAYGKFWSPQKQKWVYTYQFKVYNNQGISFRQQFSNYKKFPSGTVFTVHGPASPDPEHKTELIFQVKSSGSNMTSRQKYYSITWKPQAVVPEAQINSRTGTSLTLELLGDVPEGSLQAAIKVNGKWSDWQDSLSFEGLQPGTEYEIKLRTTETEDWFSSEEKVITAATKGIPEPPQTLPKVIDRTDTSLTIETADGQEYSIDGSKTWQTDGEFTGLSPSTEYQIISRYTETEDMLQSGASSPLTVSTKGIPTAEIIPPVITDVTETTITVEVVEGQEYALRYAEIPQESGQIMRRTAARAKVQTSAPNLVRGWTDTGKFAELSAGTKYEVITRLKETEDFVASDVGTASVEVKTKDTYKPSATVTDTHMAYIYGYPDGTVRPNNYISRAETAAMFARLFPQPDSSENPFSDVTDGMWCSTVIRQLTAANKLYGYPDGTFRPTRNITRAEFITIATRFTTPINTNVNVSFSDISGNWARKSIEQGATAGWITGYPDGTFHPDRPITRAEAMVILNRIFGRSPALTGEDFTSQEPLWSDCANKSVWYYNDVWEASWTHKYTRKR